MDRSGINAFSGDVIASDDAEKLLLVAFSGWENSGETLVYEYTYHEMKIIVEGEA